MSRADNDLRRWCIYQRERFPLVVYLPLIAAFSGGAVGFSAALRGVKPSWTSFLAAFVTSVAAFAHLRIADEFKDFDEDSRYRPYRPVPRGLVSLRELGWMAVFLALAQLAAALLLDTRLLLPLLLYWGYLGLMSREFFLGEHLRRRPLAYMVSHMAIMPVISFYATACDWLPSTGRVPAGLFWFVASSFFNGMVIEVGRKIRTHSDEEPGVISYSSVWGRAGACAFWTGAMAATLLCALLAAARTSNPWPFALLPPLFAVSGALPLFFPGYQTAGAGRMFGAISGIWTLVLYCSLGLVFLFA